MMILGLTGSIGMGKSSVSAMFESLGVPVHDSDAAVHAAMAPGGAGYFAIAAAFPHYEFPEIYIIEKKRGQKKARFDRSALGRLVFADEEKRLKLESILHPLVREDQARFIGAMHRMGKDIVLLDIPLLFETDSHQFVDVTICVDAPYDIQRARVLARPGMTEEKFHAILEKQMPSAEKCAMSDYVIPTGLGRAVTMAAVKKILRDIQGRAQETHGRTHEKGRRF